MYETVVNKFDIFFHVRNNIIFEGARFNRWINWRDRQQKATSLPSTASFKTEYGTMQEELFRDRIVVGIRDKALSDKLQLNPNLSLERAKKEICQKEVVREQVNQSKG